MVGCWGRSDLKPENLLVKLDGESSILKLGDLGMARKLEPGRAHTHEVVTQYYRAPEVLLAGTTGDLYYDLKIDMWAMGCIFAEMAEGKVRTDALCVYLQLALFCATARRPAHSRQLVTD